MGRFFSKFFTRRKYKKPQPQAMASERKMEYATDIGRVSIMWSRKITDTSLFVQIDLYNNAATTPSSHSVDHLSNLTNDQRGSCFDFGLYPSLPGQRCGFRGFNLYGRGIDVTHTRRLEFAWDFTNALYNASGDVQPVSGYYFCIAVEGEMILLLGDMKEAARNRVKAQLESVIAIPTAREETVNLRGCIYSTKAFLGGQERDIAVYFKRRIEDSMTVWIDRWKVVEVETKGRKFKGSSELNVPGGVVKIVWDRHEWTVGENTVCCTAARELAIARLAISYARVEAGSRNVENYIHLNLFVD